MCRRRRVYVTLEAVRSPRPAGYSMEGGERIVNGHTWLRGQLGKTSLITVRPRQLLDVMVQRHGHDDHRRIAAGDPSLEDRAHQQPVGMIGSCVTRDGIRRRQGLD